MGVWYVSREEVASAPDIKASAYMTRDIDRACESASRRVERLCRREFYPQTGTRYKDFPNTQQAMSGRLWLDQDELISLTSMTAGGVTIPTANVNLEPVNDGPPYTYLELNRSSTSSLAAGSTSQHALALTGVFGGAPIDEESSGTLAANITASVTSLQLSSTVGVGSLIRIGTERMIVTGKAWVASGQTLGADLASSNSATAVSVATGTAFAAGDLLMIDSELISVVDVVGNVLLVKRAFGGAPLAAHTTGATISWQRVLTVTRGAVGTTAATHASTDAAVRWLAPAPVRDLALAFALDTLFQQGSGYARTVGSGENERVFSGRPIQALADEVVATYGRSLRARAV